jgi:hypothetical protein
MHKKINRKSILNIYFPKSWKEIIQKVRHNKNARGR